MCKTGHHDECVVDDPFICHCACQPICTDIRCLKAGRYKRNYKPIPCGTCHLMPCCCNDDAWLGIVLTDKMMDSLTPSQRTAVLKVTRPEGSSEVAKTKQKRRIATGLLML